MKPERGGAMAALEREGLRLEMSNDGGFSADNGDSDSGKARARSERKQKQKARVNREQVILADKVIGAWVTALGIAAAIVGLFSHHEWPAVLLGACATEALVGGIILHVRHILQRKRTIAWKLVAPIGALHALTFAAAVASLWNWNISAWFASPVPPVPQGIQSETPTPEESAKPFHEAAAPFPTITLGCLTLFLDGDALGHGIESGTPTPFVTFRHGKDSLHALSLYETNGTLHADVNLMTRAAGAGFAMQSDVFEVYASGWDVNRNDRALEVVDENGTPIFQLIRLSRTHLTVQGVFRAFGLVTVFGPRGEFGTSPDHNFVPPHDLLPPIFRHPAWKYPGQLTGDAPKSPPQCPENIRGKTSATTQPIIITAP